jgi:putative peptide zinc metalloprotease protein
MNPTEPLLSAQWFRVAGLRPRLDAQLRAERISYRRRIWHVLVKADGSRSLRMHTAGWTFIGRADGQLTVQRLWELVLSEQRDETPTQDELIRLMQALHQAGMLGFDRRPDFGLAGVGRIARPGEDTRRQSPLALRIPLGRPDAWLERLEPRLRWLFSVPLAWAAALLLGWAVLAALVNASELQALAGERLQQPSVWLMAWLAYPLMKALHELAHALAIKHHGGSVPEWGVSLLMLTPVPFVDASAATGFPRAGQRLQVSLAGIAVELVLAALGLAVALAVQPGGVRDAGLVVFVLGSVSTLVVNGNPLLRFDGYHALTDALQLPNLATRSLRHWQSVLRERCLGVPAPHRPQPAHGEAAWLWLYAPASLAWQALLLATLVGWLGSLSFWFGLSLGLFTLWLLLLRPLVAWWRFLRGTQLGEAEQRRALKRSAGWAGAAVVLVGLLPLPAASVVQGVVWPGDQALVRAGTDGFVEQVLAADGDDVSQGQVLITLDSPQLRAERERLVAQLAALEAERYASMSRNPEAAADLAQQAARIQAELERVEERLAGLQLRAGVDGRLVLSQAEDLPGRHLRQGTLVAHIATAGARTVRVAIEQDAADLARRDAPGGLPVSVRLAGAPATAWQGRLDIHGLAPAHQLPSPALGERSGGPIAIDAADAQGLITLRDVLVGDVHLEAPFDPAQLDRVDPTRAADARERMGERAWVRIDRGHAPLALQAARAAQQLLLRHFDPAR